MEEEAAPEVMQVDVIGSPTEVAEESDDMDAGGCEGIRLWGEVGETQASRTPGDLPQRVPDGTDEELDSPSKRPQRSDDQPLTAREIRALLGGHLSEMKTAWSTIQSRVDKVEQEQARSSFEVGNLQSRTRCWRRT